MRPIMLARALFGAVLVSSLALSAAARGPTSAWLGEFDYLYWTARRSSVPFSGELTFAPDNSSFVNGLTETRYDWNSGIRVGVGRRCSAGLDLMFRYTSFRTNGSMSLGDPAVDSDGVFANLIDRSLANLTVNRDFDDGQCDFAQEDINVRYQVYDLELGKAFQTPRWSVRPFGGFRFAEIRQGHNVLYQNLSGATELDSYSIVSDVDTTAWGIRAGAETSVSLGIVGLSVFGRGGVSLMMSRFRVARNDTVVNEPRPQTRFREHTHNYDATVPQLDLAIGLRYDRGPFFVTAGYEITQWFNMYQNLDFVAYDDVDGKTSPGRADRGDLSLDGMFFRCGFVY